MKVNFATSNKFKVEEANDVGKIFGIEFVRLRIPYPEIRNEKVEKVAEEGARYVFKKLKKPVIVEDTGLYIKALNGFPGAYSKFVFQKVGCNGILKLLDKEKDREATFISAIGYCDGKQTKVFTGKIKGKITEMKAGKDGFGYDPIFQPYVKENYGKTFAQDYELKKRISHRRRAFEKFCKWLKKEKK